MGTKVAVSMVAAVALAAMGATAKPAIVFVGAHPDDSEGFAGTAFRLAGKYELHIVDLTRGERGLGAAGLRDGSTGRIREAEERAACAYLGATPHFLCETNGCCHASAAAAEMLLDLLKRIKPVAIFSHWPVDWHADHVQSAATVSFAYDTLARAGWRDMKKPELYFYEVVPGETEQFPPLYRVDVTSTMERKVAMLRLYACQNENDSLVKVKLRQAEKRGAECSPPVKYAEVFTTFDGRPVPNGVLADIALPH